MPDTLRLAVALTIVFCVAAPSSTSGQTDAALRSPPPEAIDVEMLRTAMQTAARNGIASILARIEVNEGLVIPLRQTIRPGEVVRVVESTHRYREEFVVVDQPIREKVGEREVRRPTTDEYGNVTGYQTVRIPIYRVVGTKKVRVRRLVRDDNGPIERTTRRPVREHDPIQHVPSGTLGVNAMALYVLRQAGLGNEAQQLADKLRITILSTGLPDRTWDLAWLVAGYSGLDGQLNRALQVRLVNKLIDGQIRDKGPAQGMWGPLCMHHESLAGYLSLETKIYAESQRIEKEIAGNDNPGRRLLAERKTCRDLLHLVRVALDDTATQSNGFSGFARIYQVRDTVYLAGLPYYFYNHTLADIDSTFLAVWALAQAKQNDALPAMTQRREIRRRVPAPAENTRQTLNLAQQAIMGLMQEDGTWAENNLIVANKAYDKYPELGLAGVGPENIPSVLVQHETLRSNLRGLAALQATLRAANQDAAQYEKQLEPARVNASAIMQRLLSEEVLWQPTRITSRNSSINPPAYHVFSGENITLRDLQDDERRDQLFTLADLEIDKLPVGYSSDPYSLLTAVATIYEKQTGSENAQQPGADRYDQLAYRLLVQQSEDGQWRDSGFAADVPSSLYTYALLSDLERRFKQAKQRQEAGRPSGVDAEIDLASSMTQGAARIGGMKRLDLSNTYATLAATAYLLQRTDEPIDMSQVIILSPEHAKLLDPFAQEIPDEPDQPEGEPDEEAEPGEEEEVVEEVKPPTAAQAASAVIRENQAFERLRESVREKQGSAAPDDN